MVIIMHSKIDDDKKRQLIVVGVIGLVVIIIMIVVLVLFFNKNDYKKIEKTMREQAKSYVNEQKLEIDNQHFLTLTELGIQEGIELCSKASGVIITNVSGKLEYSSYLKCFNYESEILDNSTKYIELIGDPVILINQGTMYFDEGYTKKEDVEVEIVGDVLPEPGAYTINYVVKQNGEKKTIVKRIVIVSSADVAVKEIAEDEAIMTLNGENEIYLTKNSKYEELGVSAYDKNGSLNHKVKITGKVDTSKVGDYELTYTLSNNKNVTAKRIIHVVEKKADLKIDISEKRAQAVTNNVILNVKIIGVGFTKLILPNNKELTESVTTYSITENGTYTFKAVDNYGNIINKTIIIDNIDSKLPTGSCTIKGSKFEVEASDENGIAAVNYVVNGVNTGFLRSTQYTAKEEVKTASVILKDVAGNKAELKCEVK